VDELTASFRCVNERFFNGGLDENAYSFSWKHLSGRYAVVEYSKEKSRIIINTKLQNNAELLDYVILHELLHTFRGFRSVRTHRGKFNNRLKEFLGESEFKRLEEELDALDIAKRRFRRRYVYECPNCGERIIRKKKVGGTSCAKCDSEYNPEYMLVLVEGYYIL
jgi:predicted SprT family Zn-dependent metalloprotease